VTAEPLRVLLADDHPFFREGLRSALAAVEGIEVLELVARGEDNQAIARRLVLSEKTVRNHVSNIFTKLRIGDRARAIVRAREAGLGGREPEQHGDSPFSLGGKTRQM
jgi:DNA-binding NarL/FixJ family response regulator